MKLLRKLLYFVCMAGMAIVAALAADRIGQPSLGRTLIAAALLGCVAGAPGLVHRRAWPAALVVLPVGAYLLLRLRLSLPPDTGLIGQVGYYADHLRSAAQAYWRDPFPLNFQTPEIALLVTLLVYAASGLASLAALSFRRALPAIVLLLALLGFAFTVDGADRVLWLPVVFLLLSGCLLMLSRAIERQSWRPGDVLAGGVTAAAAVALALTLLGATSVSAAKPWKDWRAWEPFSSVQSTHIGFNWMSNFASLLDPSNAREALRVTSPVATYWRANALDSFNGDAWVSSPSNGRELIPFAGSSGYTYPLPPQDPLPSGRTVTETIQLTSVVTGYLFSGGWPVRVSTSSSLGVRSTPVHSLRLDGTVGPGTSYSVTAIVPHVKPRDLVGRGRAYPAYLAPSLALPFPAAARMNGSDPEVQWRSALATVPGGTNWTGLYDLNRQIVGSATDPYEIARRIEEYLRSFTYSLTPPASRYSSPYAAFLFDTHTGYCQHFAGTMAMLLRFNGIPARVAVGFATGQRVAPKTYMVETTDAHAWVEAYFPHVGWASFDPTPGGRAAGRGASSAGTGFITPFRSASGTPSQRDSSGAQANGAQGPKPGSGLDPAGKGSQAQHAGSLWLIWLIVPAAIVAAWPFGRALLRRRRLRRGSLDDRLQASLALTRAELRDYGVDVSQSQTLQETARYLHDQLGLDVIGLTSRVEAVLYGGRCADAADLAAVAALRRQTLRRLRQRNGWLRSLLASYGLAAGRQ